MHVALLAIACAGCAAHTAPSPAATRVVKISSNVLHADELSLAIPKPPIGPSFQHLPGEFEPVRDVIIVWDEELALVMADLIATASHGARVTVVVRPDEDDASLGEAKTAVELAGGDMEAVQFLTLDYDSLWMRDYGPLVVRRTDGSRTVYDFEYFGEPNDDAISDRLGAELGPWESFELPLRAEGGNLLSDGAGRCVTSERILSDNSELSEEEIRSLLRAHLGCRRLTILPSLEGEETGHVDMFMTITGPGHALVGSYSRSQDRINAQLLDRVARRLRKSGFQVQRVPMPSNRDGQFRSHLNAVAINDVVVVPTYAADRAAEQTALRTFRKAYAGREVVGVDVDEIIELAGAIHCVIMTVAE